MINSILTYRKHDESDSGFTLIELLIVIVVLAILAGITIFALGGVSGTSAQAACQADAKTVETAIQAYNTQTGNSLATTAAAQTALVPTYLHTWPTTNSSHYTITIDASVPNQVDVTPAGGTAQGYDTEAQAVTTGTTSPATGCFAVK